MNNTSTVTKIPLKANINLDPVAENVFGFEKDANGDSIVNSQLISNTGYNFEGGVATQHQIVQNNSNSPAYSYLTEGGNLIELRPNGSDSVAGAPKNAVYLDGKLIDNIPAHGIESVYSVGSYDDMIMSDGNPIGLKIIQNVVNKPLIITIDEVSISTGAVVNTVTYTLAAGTSNGAPVCLVRQCLGRSFTWASPQYICASTNVTNIYSTAGVAQITGGTNNFRNGVSVLAFKMWNLNDYFMVTPGNISASQSSVMVISGGTTKNYYTLNYAHMQCKNGYNRIIATGNSVTGTASNQFCMSFGYQTFTSTYTSAPSSNTTIASPNLSTKQPCSSYAYVDATLVNGTAMSTYWTHYADPNSGIGTSESSGMFFGRSGGVSNQIQGYGRLSWSSESDYGSKNPFEFRLNMCAGTAATATPQFLSVGCPYSITSGYSYGGNQLPEATMGVPISTFGEIDISFGPQLNPDWSTIMWRYAGIYYFASISTSPIRPIQKITSNLYKINTISGMSVLNVSQKKLTLGSNDYHSGGYVFPNGSFTGFGSSAWYSMNIQWIAGSSASANSIDLGGSFFSYDGSTAIGAMAPVGSFLHPAHDSSNTEYSVCGYMGTGVSANNLLTVWGSSQYNNPLKSSVTLTTGPSDKIYNQYAVATYISNTSLVPIPVGTRYQGYTLGTNSLATSQAFQKTYITSGYQGTTLTSEWDGYIIGNELQINSIGFVLFSQPYIFDGKSIFKLVVNNGGVSVPITSLCRGDGLIYLTTSFQYAFFYSQFDNSIWAFDGGYSLSKFKRLDGMGAIQNGSFNAFNNTLTIITSTFIVQYVDGVWSAIPRSSLMIPDGSESNMRIYDTINGNVFGNSVNWWRYAYYNTGALGTTTSNGISTTETVYPFNYQTSYIGPDQNRRMVLSAITFSIYNEDKSATNVVVTVRGYDQDGLHQQPYVQTFKLTPTMFLGGGFIPVLRTQPWKQRFLAASVQFQCSTDMRIYDLQYHWADENQALPSAARSQ
jgi:hypothetical protein